ncbi:hypothetical protein SHIRM173S_09628 [Streptomyces hirsutus]
MPSWAAEAGSEDGGDLTAVHDAAGRDDRDAHGLPHLADQRQQSDAGAVRLRVVPVGALMAAGLDALRDHRVDARLLHGPRLVGGGGGGQRERACAAQGVQDVAGGHAEDEASTTSSGLSSRTALLAS